MHELPYYTTDNIIGKLSPVKHSMTINPNKLGYVYEVLPKHIEIKSICNQTLGPAPMPTEIDSFDVMLNPYHICNDIIKY